MRRQQVSNFTFILMRQLGIFVLIASIALPLETFAEDLKAARRAARTEAAVSRMVARSRPANVQPRPASAMPGMQRQMRPPQQRAFGGEGMARSGRMMNPEMSRPLRSRVYDAPAAGRDFAVSPRVSNTAAAIEQSAAVPVGPRIGVRDGGNRADRVRNWSNRDRNRNSRNGGVEAPVGPMQADVSANSSTATSPTTQEHEPHRRGRNRNWRERHDNWHERHEGDPNFDGKHRRYHDRQHRNRDWWRSNYNRFVLFGGGYYYWNRGYWYPAYGYDPYYSTYTYDAPLYSYNGLPPGQVISLVQSRLQQRGYYRSAVDGSFGPRTRQALLDFQADHGLSMTGEIDQDTLSALDFN